jgi:hypothetical protein
MIGDKNSQLMSPPTSKANPPTLPSHQNLEANGRELDMRATKNDKAAIEHSTIPSLRLLMFMVRLAA